MYSHTYKLKIGLSIEKATGQILEVGRHACKDISLKVTHPSPGDRFPELIQG